MPVFDRSSIKMVLHVSYSPYSSSIERLIEDWKNSSRQYRFPQNWSFYPVLFVHSIHERSLQRWNAKSAFNVPATPLLWRWFNSSYPYPRMFCLLASGDVESQRNRRTSAAEHVRERKFQRIRCLTSISLTVSYEIFNENISYFGELEFSQIFFYRVSSGSIHLCAFMLKFWISTLYSI